MGKFSRLGNALYSGERSIDFVGRRWLWYAISAVILTVAIGGWAVKGLNYGIEFTGGEQVTVSLPESEITQDNADLLREAVAGTGIDNASAPVVTTAGRSGIIIQTEPLTSEETDQVLEAVQEAVALDDPAEDLTVNEIGASWGQEVADRALLGLAVFLVLVVLFIWAYFRQWKMSLAAMVAMAHDVVITVGIYALSGFEVTPAAVTGLLAILGFSLYDTVVVFDKVRENTANLRQSRQTYAGAANLAVNQTLVRSINTSIVALIPVGAILYVSAVQLGASSLKDLALSQFVGMAAGAYSSIFVATPFLVQLKGNESDVKLAEKRARARERAAADRYAAVPAFTEDMPVVEEPGGSTPVGALRHDVEHDADDDVEDDRRAVGRAVAPPRAPEASGRGRVVPPAKGSVAQTNAAGRPQPSRQTRSKRGRK